MNRKQERREAEGDAGVREWCIRVSRGRIWGEEARQDDVVVEEDRS